MKQQTLFTGIALPTLCLAGINGATAQTKKVAKPAYSAANKTVTVYLTSKNSEFRMTQQAEKLHFSAKPQPVETEVAVFVDPSKTFQTMLGVGGALTDASAETFYKLPADKQKELLTAYYDKTAGIGYTMARTNIQSCDFSSDTYSYVGNNDAGL